MDRSMLNKATSADETPTPGYLYGDIAKSTFGDPAASQQLAEYLLKKLEKDNPHVKVKCLRIIRHVCDGGKGDFRRLIQKKADVVKACLQYRGTPDTLKGDSFNKAVRDEAATAITSVFASDSSTNAYGMSAAPASKMQGFGSESGPSGFGSGSGGGGPSSFGGSNNTFGGGGGGGGGAPSYGSSSAGGMVGFGNPNFNNSAPPEENAYLKSAKETGFSMFSAAMSKVQSATGQPMPGSSMPGGGNQNMDSASSSYRAPNMNMQAVGGGLGTGMQGRWGGDSQPQQGRPPPPSSGGTGTGEYEAKVVDAVCAPGGPRVAPSSQALEEFCRKCESLDSTQTASALRTKLGDPSWQTRLKALHAIEACHDKGLDAITGHVAQFSSELLFECATEYPQCKAKAEKVLYLLGMGEKPTAAAPQHRVEAPVAVAAPAPAAACMDLLDMGDDDLIGGSSAVAAPSCNLLDSPPVGGADGGLLGGLSSAPQPYAAPSAMPDMLGMGAPSPMPQQAPAPSPAGGSLFGNLSMSSSAPPQMSPEPPSLLAGLQAASPPAQTAPSDGGLGGMFGGLSMGVDGAMSAPNPEQAPSVPDIAATAANTALGPMDAQRGSHLNFLSGGAPMGQPAAGGPMGQQPGMMNGGPMMMQQGPMGQQMGQPGMGMPMGQPGGMGQQMMGQQPMGPGPMMGQGMAPMNGMMGQQPNGMMGQQNGMMGQMGQMGGMGMGMPQMQQQMGGGMMGGMGMGGGMMGGGMMGGGYGGNGNMGMPNAMAGGTMAGGTMGGGPGSAFGFIGAAGALGAQAPVDPVKSAQDSAFSFVSDEMLGARS